MTLTLGHVTFDAVDATRLAAFWAGVLQRPVDEGASEAFATVGATGDDPMRPALMFVQVPEPKQGKNRVHVDLQTADLPGELERVVALGAVRIGEHDEYGATWVTLADSEGNLFDIVASEE